jgi:DME family drug/metabolite transporter
VLLAMVAVAGYQLCFFAAVHKTGVAVGTIVAIGSAPVLAGVIARLTGGPAPGRRWLIATGAAVAGCAVLISGGQSAGVNLPGIGLALLAGLSYAC